MATRMIGISIATLGLGAVVLVGCSGNNDLTGPSSGLAPAAALTADVSNSAVDTDGLPTDSFTTENVTTASKDWKKADVIFPKGTKFVQFHLEDLYTDDCNRAVHVTLSTDSSARTLDTNVVSDLCSDLLLHRAPNPEFYIGRLGPENYSSLRPESPLKNGEMFTLSIKVDRSDYPDSRKFRGLDGVMHIAVPNNPYYRGSNTITFKVGVGKTKSITFAVAK